MINNVWCSLFLSSSLACPAQNIKVNWATNTGGMRKDTSSKYTWFPPHLILKLQIFLLRLSVGSKQFIFTDSPQRTPFLCYYYLTHSRKFTVFLRVVWLPFFCYSRPDCWSKMCKSDLADFPMELVLLTVMLRGLNSWLIEGFASQNYWFEVIYWWPH